MIEQRRKCESIMDERWKLKHSVTSEFSIRNLKWMVQALKGKHMLQHLLLGCCASLYREEMIKWRFHVDHQTCHFFKFCLEECSSGNLHFRFLPIQDGIASRSFLCRYSSAKREWGSKRACVNRLIRFAPSLTSYFSHYLPTSLPPSFSVF